MDPIEEKTLELMNSISETHRISNELRALKSMPVLPEKSKNMCSGCEDAYYHTQSLSGCWTYAAAKIVMKKLVGINDRSPWKHPATPMLSCYHCQGYVTVAADQEQ